jgi:hypothetical protein
MTAAQYAAWQDYRQLAGCLLQQAAWCVEVIPALLLLPDAFSSGLPLQHTGGRRLPAEPVLEQFLIISMFCLPFVLWRCPTGGVQLSHDYRKAEPGMFNLLFGAYGFPVGLSMCVINGASLFTSNIAYMMAAFMERKVSGPRCLWVVGLSYFSNLAGGTGSSACERCVVQTEHNTTTIWS